MGELGTIGDLEQAPCVDQGACHADGQEAGAAVGKDQFKDQLNREPANIDDLRRALQIRIVLAVLGVWVRCRRLAASRKLPWAAMARKVRALSMSMTPQDNAKGAEEEEMQVCSASRRSMQPIPWSFIRSPSCQASDRTETGTALPDAVRELKGSTQ